VKEPHLETKLPWVVAGVAVAAEMHAAGASLDAIRAAIDARFRS